MSAKTKSQSLETNWKQWRKTSSRWSSNAITTANKCKKLTRYRAKACSWNRRRPNVRCSVARSKSCRHSILNKLSRSVANKGHPSNKTAQKKTHKCLRGHLTHQESWLKLRVVYNKMAKFNLMRLISVLGNQQEPALKVLGSLTGFHSCEKVSTNELRHKILNLRSSTFVILMLARWIAILTIPWPVIVALPTIMFASVVIFTITACAARVAVPSIASITTTVIMSSTRVTSIITVAPSLVSMSRVAIASGVIS